VGAAIATVGGILVLRGGLSAKALGDTWRWNAGACSPLQDFGPPRRSAHAKTYDSYRTQIALLGDILSRGVETAYAVSLESNGKRTLVESSKILPTPPT
jgi:hypothetical protein